MTAPNLIIIGAQKCGTTSLHRYLQAHPEITMHRLKETDFFLDPDPAPAEIDAYRRSFSASTPITGEASPNYTNLPKSAGTAERMAAFSPEARLIYLVRDPVERLISQYLHYRAAGVERRPIAEAIRDPTASYLHRSRYAMQLEPFLAAFPASRIRVVAAEDLLGDRAGTLRSLFSYLGVRADFASAEFDRLWEQTQGKGRLYRIVWPLAAAARGRGLTTPPAVKWRLQRLLRPSGRGRRAAADDQGAPAATELLSEADHRFLHAELAADAERFADLGPAAAGARARWRTRERLAAGPTPVG